MKLNDHVEATRFALLKAHNDWMDRGAPGPVWDMEREIAQTDAGRLTVYATIINRPEPYARAVVRLDGKQISKKKAQELLGE